RGAGAVPGCRHHLDPHPHGVPGRHPAVRAGRRPAQGGPGGRPQPGPRPRHGRGPASGRGPGAGRRGPGRVTTAPSAEDTHGASGHRDLTWVVALAASLWGTSALLREPLSAAADAATIVLYEHLVLVLVLLPWLPAALRAWAASPARVRAAAVLIGGGSSALATTLFTAAFRLGDPITPQILQKLQPLIAILLAG